MFEFHLQADRSHQSPKSIPQRLLLQSVDKSEEAILTQRKSTLQRDVGFDIHSSSEQSDPRSPTPGTTR